MSKIAIFASGNGTNAEAIIKYFRQNPAKGEVSLLLSNKSSALALQRAEKCGVETLTFNSKEFLADPSVILDCLEQRGIKLIVLAGYMQLIPSGFIKRYKDRIVNIHPALLPNFGGKGMYGMNVHRAVIESGAKESGLTIHYVDEQYDKGAVIFQTRVKVEQNDTAESLAQRVMKLEHKHYPEVISQIILNFES